MGSSLEVILVLPFFALFWHKILVITVDPRKILF